MHYVVSYKQLTQDKSLIFGKNSARFSFPHYYQPFVFHIKAVGCFWLLSYLGKKLHYHSCQRCLLPSSIHNCAVLQWVQRAPWPWNMKKYRYNTSDDMNSIFPISIYWKTGILISSEFYRTWGKFIYCLDKNDTFVTTKTVWLLMSILIIFYCWSESKRTYIKDVILSKPYLSSSKKK